MKLKCLNCGEKVEIDNDGYEFVRCICGRIHVVRQGDKMVITQADHAEVCK